MPTVVTVRYVLADHNPQEALESTQELMYEAMDSNSHLVAYRATSEELDTEAAIAEFELDQFDLDTLGIEAKEEEDEDTDE
jgi:hypothetical protein